MTTVSPAPRPRSAGRSATNSFDPMVGKIAPGSRPGTPRRRSNHAAIAAWFERRRGVPGLDPGAIFPTIGSKEFVALLPALLGLGAGDTVVIPEIAYPTYDVGARLVD